MDRKQVGNLIQAFQETFKNRKDVGLILKTYLHNMSSPDAAFTRRRIDGLLRYEYPKVHLIHGDLYDTDMKDLYCHPKVKAFVSLTSGEGWNRCAAEAVACDLPVILPKWSGHMDFVNDSFSTLIDTTLVPVPSVYWRTKWFLPESKWCAVSPQDVSSKLLHVFNNYKEVKENAVTYGKEFREKWEKKTVYDSLVELLDGFEFPQGSELPVTSF